MISLQEYKLEYKEAAVALIRGFWKAHNNYWQTIEEAEKDLAAWTAEGHKFYLICMQEKFVGFLHMGSRGGAIDWLEDLFVLPEYQRQGIGTETVRLAEELVKEYSTSVYIEAAARNDAAIHLYRRLGYDCLNTVTIRKDFPSYEYDVKSRENVLGLDFEVRTDKETALIE